MTQHSQKRSVEAAKARRDKDSPQVPEKQSKEDTEALKADLDALLDEVEGVLEENAEEFVAGYVQKGGE